MSITESMKNIQNHTDKYRREIERALKKYRADKARIAETYRENVAVEKLASARMTAHSDIYAADRMLAEDIKLELADARRALNFAIMPDEKNSAIRTIRMYQEFGVTPTESELRAIAREARGDVFALRALSKWVESHNYQVSAPSADSYERELQDMERYFSRPPFLYAPFEYVSELEEVAPNKAMYREDGTVYMDGGKPDMTDILTCSAYFGTVCKNVTRAISEWGNTFIPEIKKIDPAEHTTQQEAADAQEAENKRFENAVNAQADALRIEQPKPEPAPEMSRAEQAAMLAHYE